MANKNHNRPSGRPRGKTVIPLGTFIDEVLDEKMSATEIARRHGVSVACVSARMKRLGLNRRAMAARVEREAGRIAREEGRLEILDMQKVMEEIQKMAEVLKTKFHFDAADIYRMRVTVECISRAFDINSRLLVPDRSERKTIGTQLRELVRILKNYTDRDQTNSLAKLAVTYKELIEYLGKYVALFADATAVQYMVEAILTEIAKESEPCRDRIARRIQAMRRVAEGNPPIGLAPNPPTNP